MSPSLNPSAVKKIFTRLWNMLPPLDNLAYRFPVSIKGVVLIRGNVILLRNNRNEWELPGGKLELDETPEACLTREIQEETNLDVSVVSIIDSWVYHISKGINVLIITYGCQPKAIHTIKPSVEHTDLQLFNPKEIDHLAMPAGYKESIHTWSNEQNNV